jgi:hypothetical protein
MFATHRTRAATPCARLLIASACLLLNACSSTSVTNAGGLANTGGKLATSAGGGSAGGAVGVGGIAGHSTGGAVAAGGSAGNSNATGGSAGTASTNAKWYVCDCSCNCASQTITYSEQCLSPTSSSCSSCIAVCQIGCASDTTYGAFVSVDNPNSKGCNPSTVSTLWSCSVSTYGGGPGDGCDCGCGILDPDCATSSVTSCEYCNGSYSCGKNYTDCSPIVSNNNATCSFVPATWKCAPAYYGTGDGCDCGCGVVDPDCTSATSACDNCDDPGSCATTCTTISLTNNAVCTL